MFDIRYFSLSSRRHHTRAERFERIIKPLQATGRGKLKPDGSGEQPAINNPDIQAWHPNTIRV
jgi:hypothetical protein